MAGHVSSSAAAENGSERVPAEVDIIMYSYCSLAAGGATTFNIPDKLSLNTTNHL